MLGLTRRNGETGLARPQESAFGRWDPWGEFNRIRADMDTLFDRFFGTVPRYGESYTRFAPAVDLYETQDDLVLNAYLPGMSRDDIHLEVLGNILHIWGERKPQIPSNDVTVHLSQGPHGTFDFRYTLPTEVKTDAVEATYRSGVLEVRMPKADWAKPRAVEVQIQG